MNNSNGTYTVSTMRRRPDFDITDKAFCAFLNWLNQYLYLFLNLFAVGLYDYDERDKNEDGSMKCCRSCFQGVCENPHAVHSYYAYFSASDFHDAREKLSTDVSSMDYVDYKDYVNIEIGNKCIVSVKECMRKGFPAHKVVASVIDWCKFPKEFYEMIEEISGFGDECGMILNTRGWVLCGKNNSWFKHTPNKRTKLMGDYEYDQNAAVLTKLECKEDVVMVSNVVEMILLRSPWGQSENERVQDSIAEGAMHVREILMMSYTRIKRKALLQAYNEEENKVENE